MYWSLCIFLCPVGDCLSPSLGTLVFSDESLWWACRSIDKSVSLLEGRLVSFVFLFLVYTIILNTLNFFILRSILGSHILRLVVIPVVFFR